MPYPSPNSSSARAKSEQYEHESYINQSSPEQNRSEYPPSKSKNRNIQPDVADNTEDFFYGTEELLDALPRPWTRSLLYMLIGFAVIVIPLTMVAQVDETGSARGRIEPLEARVRLDSQANGSVTAVKVNVGETIRAGQVLLELESDLMQTELQQAQAKLQGLNNQRSQLELLKNQLMLTVSQQQQQNQSQESEKVAQVNQAQQNLDAKQSTNPSCGLSNTNILLNAIAKR